MDGFTGRVLKDVTGPGPRHLNQNPNRAAGKTDQNQKPETRNQKPENKKADTKKPPEGGFFADNPVD